jgi:hypothetical protein
MFSGPDGDTSELRLVPGLAHLLCRPRIKHLSRAGDIDDATAVNGMADRRRPWSC